MMTAALLAACAPTAVERATIPDPTVEPVVILTDTGGVIPAQVDASGPEGLAYVREEEKLAHDVYLFLAEQWDAAVFTNIAASEQTHTDTIQGLLAVYNLADPAAGAQPGQFTDPTLQALYDRLTAQGSFSLAEALKVGAAIEEIDILDLQARLAGDLPDDVRLAYENLLAGSYNHLSAFTSTLLRQTGETYVPQYMTLEAYESALEQATIGGNGNGNGYRGGQP
jgi:hypothetical protein